MLTIRNEQMDALARAQRGPVIFPCNPSWIEVQVLDMENNPVPHVRYEIRLSGGIILSGSTDRAGLARYDGIPSGECEISLPDFDKDAWHPL